MREIDIMLTGTSNPYLKPELPLAGRLQILEAGTDGRIIHAVFRVREGDKLSAAVEVPDAEFTYSPLPRTPVPPTVEFTYYLNDSANSWECADSILRTAKGETGMTTEALAEKLERPFYEIALRCQLDTATGAVTILGVGTT